MRRETDQEPSPTPEYRRKPWLRRTLRLSQQEAVASATMTAANDNFLNAFAVFLQATAVQMGWLTAIPQLFGAIGQVISAWLANHLHRKPLIIVSAVVQALVVFGLVATAMLAGIHGTSNSLVTMLILLAVAYFSCLNVIQPHWRAWMGGVVPARRRGKFFAQRTRLTMISSLLVFILGGALLSKSAELGLTWAGFAALFAIAGLGRMASARLLYLMHDPGAAPSAGDAAVRQSWRQVRDSFRDPTFRDYSLFVAAMQGAVAISAPFFAVYMLHDLKFTYLEFSLNSIASVATQFVLLRYWGRFSDRFGNRWVMVTCSCIIPVLPLLWLVSPSFYYLLFVQMVSGVAWSGFTLSTANYLYDIRPHHTNFAFYAAIQSASSALAVFCGALLGGFVASAAPAAWQLLDFEGARGNPLFIVFVVTAVLRISIAALFLPRLHEPLLRKRPDILEVIFRVSRLSAVSGVVLDWMSVTKRTRRRNRPHDPDQPW